MTKMKRRLRRIALALALCAVLPVRALAAETLVPMGRVVGIELETDGVTVAGFAQVETESGSVSPAADAGLKTGDVITALDQRRTRTAAEFLSALAELRGGAVTVEARRAGKKLMFQLTPALNTDGKLQLGLWLRDGVSGIGTVTYYDPASGSFGALGHGISDPESGALLPFDGGSITDAAVVDVVPGAPGAPGELCGQADRGGALGTLERNTDSGIFGTAEFACDAEPIPVAEEEEVRLGAATILATVDGGDAEEYDIEISRIYRRPEEHRFLLITVTDPRLLERTGGIVQGMSGSPILQDGKLVGAVTHVLLSDATRGYGISIRDMLKAAA